MLNVLCLEIPQLTPIFTLNQSIKSLNQKTNKYSQVWFSNRRARLRKHTGAGGMPNIGPQISALSLPQYSGNIGNTSSADAHQVASHYDHLMSQAQHAGYPSGFQHSTLMPQNYTGSVHFQHSVDYSKISNEDYTKFTSEQLAKMTQPTSPLSNPIKTYADHMNEANWNQMYGAHHHQVYGPPNEYSQMQQGYSNPNAKYWS